MCFINYYDEVKNVQNDSNIVIWNNIVEEDLFADEELATTIVDWQLFDYSRILNNPEIYFNFPESTKLNMFEVGCHVSLVAHTVSIPFFYENKWERHEAFSYCFPCTYGMQTLPLENPDNETVYLTSPVISHEIVNRNTFESLLELGRCDKCNIYMFHVLNNYTCYLCNEI